MGCFGMHTGRAARRIPGLPAVRRTAHGLRRTPHPWPASCATYCTRAAPHAASLACQLCGVLYTGCATRRIPGLPAVRRTAHGLRRTPHSWPAWLAAGTQSAPQFPHIRLNHIPRQDNYWDCGLFVLTYMDFFSHDAPDHMPKDYIAGA